VFNPSSTPGEIRAQGVDGRSEEGDGGREHNHEEMGGGEGVCERSPLPQTAQGQEEGRSCGRSLLLPAAAPAPVAAPSRTPPTHQGADGVRLSLQNKQKPLKYMSGFLIFKLSFYFTSNCSQQNGVWGRQLFEPLARRVLPAPKAFGDFSIMKSYASPARASR